MIKLPPIGRVRVDIGPKPIVTSIYKLKSSISKNDRVTMYYVAGMPYGKLNMDDVVEKIVIKSVAHSLTRIWVDFVVGDGHIYSLTLSRFHACYEPV